MANLGERTEHEMLDMPERERLDVDHDTNISRLMMITYFMQEPLYRRAFELVCETEPARLADLVRQIEARKAA